jgi:hypothetical protein
LEYGVRGLWGGFRIGDKPSLSGTNRPQSKPYRLIATFASSTRCVTEKKCRSNFKRREEGDDLRQITTASVE